ncbi:including n-acetylases of ribosomal protein [Lophiotrema nucula]|uniref:Including n-acetylases of ribosomal protein n=1 Tax=Lophiotrema nucula TaxID=690887 RepID=A0A6A5ZGB0_9PLEO|nr:including n-acetylases of ribosomal protein [Lophiotrema nucula]
MTDPNFYIETPRLYISYYIGSNDAHCDFILALSHDPKFTKGQGGASSPLKDREAARNAINVLAEQQAKDGFGRFLVSLKSPDAVEATAGGSFAEIQAKCEMVGTVTMKLRPHPKAPKVPDMGYSLLSPYHGKGYATEAAKGMLKYFEEERGVKDMVAFCYPDNEESKNVMRRLGFEDRGVWLVKGLGWGEYTEEGSEDLVWAKPGMDQDLKVYGIGV